jgi:hypothetical protein
VNACSSHWPWLLSGKLSIRRSWLLDSYSCTSCYSGDRDHKDCSSKPVEENCNTLSQKYLITTEIRVLEWGQISHSNIGTVLGSVLGLACWIDPQYRLQQNLCSFTTYWPQNDTNPESQIIHFFSLERTQKESVCCYCSYLSVPSTPFTNQLHGPSRNYPRLTY